MDERSGGPGIAPAAGGAAQFDAAEDHGQHGGGDTDRRGLGGWEGEGATFQAPEVQGEAVALPGEDLQPIAATVLEDKQVAGERVSAEVGGDNGTETVKALAAVDGCGTQP